MSLHQAKLSDTMSKESGFEDDCSSTFSGTTTASMYTPKTTAIRYRNCPTKIHFKCGKHQSEPGDISFLGINPWKILFSVVSKEELKCLNDKMSKTRKTEVSVNKRNADVIIITTPDDLVGNDANSWKEDIVKLICQYLDDGVHEERLEIKHEKFELAKRKLHLTTETNLQFSSKVLVVFEKDSKLAHIVGRADAVNAFAEEVVADVEKSEFVTWEQTFNKVESDLAHYGLLRTKLRNKFPLIDIAEESAREQLVFSGFEGNVHDAKGFVNSFFVTTSQLTTTLSTGKMELVTKKGQVRKHIREKLKMEDRTKDWTWHLYDNNIILTGPKETSPDGTLISNLLYEREFMLSEFESETVFTSEKWEKKLSGLKANHHSHMMVKIDQDHLLLLCTYHFKDVIEREIENMLIQTKTLKVITDFGEFLDSRGTSVLQSRRYDMASDFLEYRWKTETSEIEVEGTKEGVEELIKTFSVLSEGFKKQAFAITSKETFSRLISDEGVTLMEKVGSQTESLLKVKSAPVIKVVREKIEEQKTSIIINSVSTDLKLNVGQAKIATAIYEKGGDEFQRHILTKWPDGIKYGDMVVTEKRGNLACDWVFNCCLRGHTDNETTRMELKGMLMKCFKETKKEDKKYRSIAIPALGTGVHKYPADIAARTTFDALCEFCSQNINTSLEEIKIVLFPEAPQTVIQHFQDEFSRRSVETTGLVELESGSIAQGYLWIHSASQDAMDRAISLLREGIQRGAVAFMVN